LLFFVCLFLAPAFYGDQLCFIALIVHLQYVILRTVAVIAFFVWLWCHVDVSPMQAPGCKNWDPFSFLIEHRKRHTKSGCRLFC